MFLKLREKNPDTRRSFKTLQILIGVLGMLMPLICGLGGYIFGGYKLQSSISAYFYTNCSEIFTGTLICLAAVMATYRGYERVDDIVSTITGLLAVGIAIFPCLLEKVSGQPVGFFQIISNNSQKIHVVCAALFFLFLAINSIFIFTLTRDKKNMSSRKKIRNAIYIGCGIIILIVLAILLFLNIKYTELELEKVEEVFWLETILLEAFGVSWLLKAGHILKDKELKESAA